MQQVHSEDLGKLVLRATIGLLLLFHAQFHMASFLHAGHGISISSIVVGWGLPVFAAYVAVLFETLGCVSIILGFYARIGACAIAVFMLCAVLMVHVMEVPGIPGTGNHLFLLGTNPVGAHDAYRLEIQAFYLFGAVAIALLGAGRYSVNALLRRDSGSGSKRDMAWAQK